jgi:hypothetical protein
VHRATRQFAAYAAAGNSNTSYSLDEGRLADVDRKLALVRQVTPVGLIRLRRIAERALELIRTAESEAVRNGLDNEDNGSTGKETRHLKGPRRARGRMAASVTIGGER